jgi:hypothetical protein
MEKRSLLSDDPFYVSGENHLDRELLARLIGRQGHFIRKRNNAVGHWQTKATASRNTRQGNYNRSWFKGFYQRIGVALVAGIFLIAPMWLMVLHNTLYTGLVSTTAFVAAFGLMSATFLTSLMDVMSTTAAYAAVLVVFVGLTTESTAGA